MSRSFGFTLVLLVMLAPAMWAQSKEDASTVTLLTPGLWEVTVQMEAPIVGAPSMSEVCIVGDQAKVKAPKTKAKDDCQATDVPSASNEVAYTVQCSKQKRSTSVKFTYYGDRYEGTSVTNLNGIEVKVKYTAKRVGACDPEDGPLSGGK
jgi:hypothetical protein